MTFIGLGYQCSIATFLRDLGQRNISLPLDWIMSLSLQVINDLIKTNFEYFLNKDVLVNYDYFFDVKKFGAIPTFENIFIFNNHHKGIIVRHHDIINNQEHRTKMQVRINRFIDLLKNKEDLVFIRHLNEGHLNQHLLNGMFPEFKDNVKNLGLDLKDIEKNPKSYDNLLNIINDTVLLINKYNKKNNNKLILLTHDQQLSKCSTNNNCEIIFSPFHPNPLINRQYIYQKIQYIVAKYSS